MAFITTTAASIASGGTINGDITITGDLKVEGEGSFTYDQIIEGSSTFTSGNDANGTIAVLSGNASQYSKIFIGTDSGKATIGVSGATDTFFTGTAQDDLVVRADADSRKIHLGVGTSGTAELVIANNAIGIGAASPSSSLHISNASSNGQVALIIDQNNTSNKALEIDSEQTSGNIFHINNPQITTGTDSDINTSNDLYLKGGDTIYTLKVPRGLGSAVHLIMERKESSDATVRIILA